MDEPALRVLSLGAGVQSSTLYLMAVRGRVRRRARPDASRSSPTPSGSRRHVYDVARLRLDRVGGGQLIPIHRVTAGNIRQAALRKTTRSASMPLYVQSEQIEGRLRRQCTREFKIEPVTREVRRQLGVAKGRRVPKGTRVEMWMGISLDEVSRMKPNRMPWIDTRWPLIDRGMTRHSCETWLAAHDFPTPPKSACIGCPFTDDTRWRDMKLNRPDEFRDAVDFDHAIRRMGRGVTNDAFLHRSLTPLDAVDFASAEDRGQINFFENECEGMCGV
jgi:hypothetical protein